jgi:hypothetical protein
MKRFNSCLHSTQQLRCAFHWQLKYLENFCIPHEFFHWIFCVESISTKYLEKHVNMCIINTFLTEYDRIIVTNSTNLNSISCTFICNITSQTLGNGRKVCVPYPLNQDKTLKLSEYVMYSTCSTVLLNKLHSVSTNTMNNVCGTCLLLVFRLIFRSEVFEL